MTDGLNCIKKPLRTGLFGGSFDPVHFGHLQAAQLFIDQLQLKQLVFVPAGKPWQKLKTQTLAKASDRLNMLQLAIANLSADTIQISIDNEELINLDNSYTINTLIRWRQRLGTEAIIYLLIGIDQFVRLNTWYCWLDLFKFANICVVNRPDFCQKSFPADLNAQIKCRQRPLSQLPHRPFGNIFHLPELNCSISSTKIRQELTRQLQLTLLARSQTENNDSIDDQAQVINPLQSMLPEKVLSYIKNNSLYS